MLLVVLYVGPLSVINLSTYDEANEYLHQTQMCCEGLQVSITLGID